jgi:cytochrome c-type biogenesis protein CcmF
MKFGMVLIVLAFISGITSAVYYWLSAKNEETGKNKKNKAKKIDYKNYGRYCFYVSLAMITFAAAYLYYLIFNHQFQVRYIYQYSSRDLPFGFLLSSFWAGQEGSFLLWTLFLSWLGLIFIHTSKQFENYGMFFMNIVQAFFLLLLIKASPFEVHAGGAVPVDGAGLNPLLQNFWMVIHPPILFIGYAAATFPFVIALTALIRNTFTKWVDQALPWVLGVSITLGAGIIIGAFWSYETLGWGGYWGWDPVENSSLIPWLTTLALFHGLIIERRFGALIKSNYSLAIVSFILVIYATFLTRSGVLADFSVHSFQDLGINEYLIIFLLLITIFGFGFLFSKFKEMKGADIDFSTINRENVLLAGMLLLVASGTLTILGTSSPIISGWFGEPSQVDISFYNKVNLPIAIAMGLFIALAPLLRWHEESFKNTLKRFLFPVLLTFLFLVFSIYMGVQDIINIIFLGFSILAIWSNLFGVIERFKINWRNIAAPFAHFGVGLMFVGIIISGTFDKTEKFLLIQGQPQTVFNYQLTYLGVKTPPDGKNVMEIKVNQGSDEYLAKPRLYYNQMTQGNMREPDIKYGAFVDLYIAPLELRRDNTHNHGSSVILKKGEFKKVQDLEVQFNSFKMSSDHQSGDFTIGAELIVKWGEKEFELTPFLIMGKTGSNSKPVVIENYDKKVGIKLTSVDADNKAIQLEFEGLSAKVNEPHIHNDQLLVEVSEKPFMNILWLGTIILTLGTILAIYNRIKDNE